MRFFSLSVHNDRLAQPPEREKRDTENLDLGSEIVFLSS